MVCDENNTTGVFVILNASLQSTLLWKGYKKNWFYFALHTLKLLKALKYILLYQMHKFYETLLFCEMYDYKDNLKANTEN